GSFGTGTTPYLTLGNCCLRYGISQPPSKAIAARCFPNASPAQPAPTLVGITEEPSFWKPVKKSSDFTPASLLKVACEPSLFSTVPPAANRNAAQRDGSALSVIP